MNLRDVAMFVCDLLFPAAFPLSPQQLAREDQIRAEERRNSAARVNPVTNATELSGFLEEAKKLEEEESGRKQGVESRLTSILGLSSIAGTIVFGAILAQAVGTIQAPTRQVSLIMTFGALYLALQISSAILAAVRGLGRQPYEVSLAYEVLPAVGEGQLDYLKRQIDERVDHLGCNRIQNNKKVSQMATAHRAMKNFIFAVILLAVAGAFAAYNARPAGDPLIQRLKNDRELNEMLRGPQGPKGDPGPPGPRGEPGTKQTGHESQKKKKMKPTLRVPTKNCQSGFPRREEEGIGNWRKPAFFS